MSVASPRAAAWLTLAVAALGAGCARRDEPAALGAAGEAGSDGEPVLVAYVGDDGVVTIDGAALLEDKAILARAEAFHQRAPRGQVVVHSRPAALHGRTVRVIDLLHEAELTRVAVDVR